MQAIILEQEDKKTIASLGQLDPEQLYAENLLVNIEWSSINYKDTLASTGKNKIVKFSL